MKKKILIILLISISLLIGGTAIYRYVRKSTPERTIQSFEKAVNRYDINGMIDCLLPEVQEKADKLIQHAENLTDTPIALLIDTIPFLSGILDIDTLPNLQLVILEKEILDEKAIIVVNVNVEGREPSVKVEITLIKLENRWYIKSATPKTFY